MANTTEDIHMAESNSEFPTIIGPDATFKGELTFEKGLKLQGKFQGRINTAGHLHVAKEARMEADVEARAVVIEGEVKGNLVATDKIEIKNSARYEGDIQAAKLVVDEGASISGHVQVGPEATKQRTGNSPAVAVNRPQPQPGPQQNQPK
jgi:cytoskeletal protein CcmA (bactofilin family)